MLERQRLSVDQEIELRPWIVEDTGAFRAAADDDEIARWTGFPYGMTLAEAAELLAARCRSWDDGTGASFAIEKTKNSEILGSVGLLWIDWARREAAVAYWLTPSARGRGLATHVVKRLAEWAFAEVRLIRLWLGVDVRNPRSWAVAERAGFVREGEVHRSREIHGDWIDEFVYGLTRARFAKPYS